MSLSGKLSVLLLLKYQGLFCHFYLGQDLSSHVKEVHLFIDFKVKFFSSKFKLFFDEFFGMLSLFEGLSKLLVLNYKKRYVLSEKDVVLEFDFFEFLSGDFKAVLSDFFGLDLIFKGLDFVIFESDISLDVFFRRVEHCINSSILLI